MNHLQQAAACRSNPPLDANSVCHLAMKLHFVGAWMDLRLAGALTCHSFASREHAASSLRLTKSRAAPFLKR
jgi:hypothetical protein